MNIPLPQNLPYFYQVVLWIFLSISCAGGGLTLWMIIRFINKNDKHHETVTRKLEAINLGDIENSVVAIDLKLISVKDKVNQLGHNVTVQQGTIEAQQRSLSLGATAIHRMRTELDLVRDEVRRLNSDKNEEG